MAVVDEYFDLVIIGAGPAGLSTGTGRLLDAIEAFAFTAEQIDFLHRTEVVDDTTLDYLRDYRFTGTIRGYAEDE